MKRERLSAFNPAEVQRPFSSILPLNPEGDGFVIDHKLILSAGLEVVNRSLIKTLYITTEGFVPIMSEKRGFVLNNNSEPEPEGTGKEITTFPVKLNGKNRITLIGDDYRVEHLGRSGYGAMIFRVESRHHLKPKIVPRGDFAERLKGILAEKNNFAPAADFLR